MLMLRIRSILVHALFILAIGPIAGPTPVSAAEAPQAGGLAPDFTLETLDGRSIELKQLAAKRPIVLVVLRGWPGYQCPICTRQVNEFVSREADFARSGAQVLMVYPGPADDLKVHAQEFLQDKQWPADFLFVLDPDYAFTNAYALRWDAPGETAYPSTFVIDRGGRIRFAHISHTHGDRISAQSALEALAELRK